MSGEIVEQQRKIARDLEFHSQCSAAISAHGEWKFRLKEAVRNGAADLDPEKIGMDNQCTFGKWLYADDSAPLRHEHHYHAVRQAHAIFHQEAAAVVRACKSGNMQNAEKLIAGNSAYAKISRRLTELLRNWIAQHNGEVADDIAHGLDSVAGSHRGWVSFWACCAGILAGLAFVFASQWISFSMNSLPLSLDSVIRAHQLSPNNYLIDCAPPILGALGFVIGRFVAAQKRQSENLQVLVDKRTTQLAAQEKNLRRILENLREGIFTLHADRKIGADFSRAVESILENSEITGNTLGDVFAARVDGDTLRELEGYLDLLFDGTHNEAMLRSLNPFQHLRILAADGGKTRVINIEFQRMESASGKVDSVLCIASDVTSEHELRERLEKEQRVSADMLEMTRQIFEIGPDMLSYFRSQTMQELDGITATLRAASELDLRDAATSIFRRLHSIKGSAALLGLKTIARVAHEYEDKVAEIVRKSDPDQMDFLPLMISHGTLLRELEMFENLLAKIRNFQSAPIAQTSGGGELLGEILERLCRQTAEECQKQVHIEISGFDSDVLPGHVSHPLRDILVQLVRNSIAHGIETPSAREELGKPAVGTIQLSAMRRNGNIIITSRDDGGGFSVPAIRERAISQGLMDSKDTGKLSDSDIVKFVFQPGFSTAQTADMSAGRGIGLDLVSTRVRALQGKIRIRWQKGEFSEIHLVFPFDPAARETLAS